MAIGLDRFSHRSIFFAVLLTCQLLERFPLQRPTMSAMYGIEHVVVISHQNGSLRTDS